MLIHHGMVIRREQVLKKLREGRLPCRAVYKTWVGPAQAGQVCSGCDTPIGPEQMEFVADFGHEGDITLHRECFTTWEDECRRLLQGGDSPHSIT